MKTLSFIILSIFICHSTGATDKSDRILTSTTAMGATKKGNADASIPDWQGGIISPPKAYRKGEHHIDPFKNDAVLYTINKSNFRQHEKNMTAGQIAMIMQNTNYQIPVYPSRRCASFPQAIYDANKTNIEEVKISKDGNAITNYRLGIPFPKPKLGEEFIWNHILRYRGAGGIRHLTQSIFSPSSKTLVTKFENNIIFTNDALQSPSNNTLFKLRRSVTYPSISAGRISLIHEPINRAHQARNIWTYSPSHRRVRRTPNIGYDYPAFATQGLMTSDQLDMFNGALDRYHWKLIGKKEIIVPYNTYKLHKKSIKHKNLVADGHIAAKYLRYELHRTWVIESTLKPGNSHYYRKRTFYIDEDSWQIVAVDIYDENLNIWRVSEAHTINFYEIPMIGVTLESHYDLKTKQLLLYGLDHQKGLADYSNTDNPNYFSPSSLRRQTNRLR